jgi:hypothetical protein
MSGEKARVRFKGGRYMALLALTCGACLGTGESSNDEATVDVTPPRMLDTICAQNGYTLAGTATRTHGLTRDSCGFELGPGEGSVTIPVASLGPDTSVSLLYDDATDVRGLLVDLDGDAHDAEWVSLGVVSDTPTAAGTLPVNPRILVTSDGKHVGLVDIEIKTTYPPYGGEGCSVARRRIRKTSR